MWKRPAASVVSLFAFRCPKLIWPMSYLAQAANRARKPLMRETGKGLAQLNRWHKSLFSTMGTLGSLRTRAWHWRNRHNFVAVLTSVRPSHSLTNSHRFSTSAHAREAI
jgi:hypothetical protein